MYTRMKELLNRASDEYKVEDNNKLCLIVVNQDVFPVLKLLQESQMVNQKKFEIIGHPGKTHMFLR